MTSAWAVEGLEARLDGFRLGPVNLTIGPGRAVAVLGTSGAGKTTLLRTLAGFLPVRGGRILRDGVDLSGTPPEERGLGYVPQGLGLLPHRTVARNVGYPLEIRAWPDAARRTRELLEQFHLTALADRYPARLSGGEQQRVAIARALAADPRLIVWDEPWQGLDVLARYELGLALHELRETEQVPMVFVTHDPGLAFSVADSFLLLRRGRVVAQGDAATLLESPVDAFSARFVGFENVYDPEALSGGGPGSLRAWLRERAGPDGLAFGRPEVPSDATDAPSWEGIVRSVRPGPHGITVEAVADDLLVALRIPPAVSAPFPALGSRLRFAIDPATLHPLRARGDGAGA